MLPFYLQKMFTIVLTYDTFRVILNTKVTYCDTRCELHGTRFKRGEYVR